jgi:hypothetical protein
LNPDDVEAMHRLNWLKGNTAAGGGMSTVLSYYNELARKFLLEGKFESAFHLLNVEFTRSLDLK